MLLDKKKFLSSKRNLYIYTVNRDHPNCWNVWIKVFDKIHKCIFMTRSLFLSFPQTTKIWNADAKEKYVWGIKRWTHFLLFPLGSLLFGACQGKRWENKRHLIFRAYSCAYKSERSLACPFLKAIITGRGLFIFQ